MMKYIERSFCDNRCTFFSNGGLYLKDIKTLILSDLHLGKGAAAKTRTPIPGYDTDDTLARLELAIDTTQAKQTILLGDSFHSVKSAAELPLDHLKKLDTLSQKTNLIWIEGNHDPDLPAFIPGTHASIITVGNLIFSHQPHYDTINPERPLKGQIIGHYHPKARLKLKAKNLSSKCFLMDEDMLIMPAFGSFTGGLNILHSEIQKHLRNPQFALIIHGSDIYSYPVDRRYFLPSP